MPARPVSTDRKEIDTTYKVQTIAPDNGQAATLTRASTQQQQAVRHRDGTTSTTTKASTAADSARLASLLDFLNTVDETNKSMQDELSQHSDTSRVQAVQPNDDPLNRSLGTPGGMQSYRGTVGAGASIITATATDSSGALTTDLAVETTSAVTAKLVRQELQIKEQGAFSVEQEATSLCLRRSHRSLKHNRVNRCGQGPLCKGTFYNGNELPKDSFNKGRHPSA